MMYSPATDRGRVGKILDQRAWEVRACGAGIGEE